MFIPWISCSAAFKQIQHSLLCSVAKLSLAPGFLMGRVCRGCVCVCLCVYLCVCVCVCVMCFLLSWLNLPDGPQLPTHVSDPLAGSQCCS